MANIGQGQVRSQADRVREQQTHANQAALQSGTGVHAPLLPNQNRGDAGQDGQSQGQGQGQGNNPGTEAFQLAHQIKNLTNTGIVRTAQNLARTTQRPAIPRDSVLANIGTYGTNTFARGSLRRPGYEPGGKFSSLQGKPLRIAGEMPSDWQAQIEGERAAVNVQTKPMNRDFVANGRYNVPLRV